MSTIGSRIREKRIEMGLSVDELAEKLGKNRATVYRYESDDIENFPISVIGPLALALQISPAYLMGWEDAKKPATISDNGLGDKWTELIQLLQQVPEDKQEMLYNMIEAALKNSGQLK